MSLKRIATASVALLASATSLKAAASETVALWLFDEPEWLYPSHTIDSSDGADAPMVLGRGGRLVEGKWGRALSAEPYPDKVEIPYEGELTASLTPLPVPTGRTQEPMTWHNAYFAALMTSGENHLRKEVSFINPSESGINLGDFDWTVEFWIRQEGKSGRDGVVFEVGSGPRGENEIFTKLSLDARKSAFRFYNAATKNSVELEANALKDREWHHCALVYESGGDRLALYLDGKSADRKTVTIKALPLGDEAYMSVGRDGLWGNPMEASIDELRFSKGVVYASNFQIPGSFAPERPEQGLLKGPPLLFGKDSPKLDVVPLEDRKHVFWDDRMIESGKDEIEFNTHQPKYITRVVDGLLGQVRKHLTVIEDEQGMIRIYHGVADDYLGIRVSHDGVNFVAPDTGFHWKGDKNIVIPEPAPMGRPMIDPNAPPETRWKYVSGLEGRGVYMYTSPDGWKWKRHPTAVLSFRSGSQSSLFYDEQRQLYVGYQRTGHPMTPGGGTSREFVISETNDIYEPWPVEPLTQKEALEISKKRPLRTPIPWWLDNGPLTPGDFSVEMPTVFQVDWEKDPGGSGIYVPKGMKYPWAEDAYISFPAMYFDYEEPHQLLSRRILYHPEYEKGSGTMESHVAVSRDGVEWNRFARPAYIPMATYQGIDVHQIYMSEGMIRRGDEIWQYFYGQEEYHSPAVRNKAGNAIYRAIQRLDGFVSLDTPYEREVNIKTRPFTFDGSKLELNVDTGALGYIRVEILDEKGKVIPGFEMDNCILVNTNDVHHVVQWLNPERNLSSLDQLDANEMRRTTIPLGDKVTSDVSSLAGKVVQLRFKMRGSSLYAMQFID